MLIITTITLTIVSATVTTIALIYDDYKRYPNRMGNRGLGTVIFPFPND